MKRILIISAIFLMFCNCSMQETDTDIQMIGQDSQIYTAIIEDSSVKTFVDNKLHLFWTADDRISIFTDTYNQQYKFTGKTGDNSGNFEVVTTTGSSTSSTLSSNYAIYPYNATIGISSSEKILVNLPVIQKYAEKSCGLEANIMAAITNGVGDHHLRFQNVCGFLVVRLYGDVTIKSITLQGNNGEKIAGPAIIGMKYDQEPNISIEETASHLITVDCGNGITLGKKADSATEFWFCVPPTNFSKGITIVANDTQGRVFIKVASSSHTISRNMVNKMAAIECEMTSLKTGATDMGLSVKWGECNLGASSQECPGDYFAWGATEPWYEDGYALSSKPVWKKGKSGGYIMANAPFTSLSGVEGSEYWSVHRFEIVDNNLCLLPKYDAAHVILGGNWRMPTKKEFQELIDNCDIEETSINGEPGFLFYSHKTDNSIFIPLSDYRSGVTFGYGYSTREKTKGIYWSSSYSSHFAEYGLLLGNTTLSLSDEPRELGFTIRPVHALEPIPVTGISIEKTSFLLMIGESFFVNAMVSPSNATNRIVIWSSSDNNVASVNSGTVTGVASGTAIISAKTEDGAYVASCKVIVENKPIDMGLSVKWASCNLGANSPEEYGDHFAWGATEPQNGNNFTWTNAPFNNKSSKFDETYFRDHKNDFLYSGVLLLKYDAAHVILGGNWRMPTKKEFQELIDNCDIAKTAVKGKTGYSFISRKTGGHIFIPTNVWTSTLHNNYNQAYYYDSSYNSILGDERYKGLSIRPVCEK